MLRRSSPSVLLILLIKKFGQRRGQRILSLAFMAITFLAISTTRFPSALAVRRSPIVPFTISKASTERSAIFFSVSVCEASLGTALPSPAWNRRSCSASAWFLLSSAAMRLTSPACLSPAALS